MHKPRLLIVFLLLAGITFSQTKNTSELKYKDGRELIKAMLDRYYPDKWYRYFTFSQNTDFYRNDSLIKQEVWHEAYRPGGLIIKIGSKDSKKGRIYSNFTVHSFEEGKPTQKTSRVHELLLIGLDVYFFKPELTIHLLDSLGYDLGKIREDQLDGRKVYVVGAEKGDEQTGQFWIDAERLYMHRVVVSRKGKVNDIVFGAYKKIKNKWVATYITFKTDNRLALTEKYFDIKFPKTVKEDWFDPEKFNQVILD